MSRTIRNSKYNGKYKDGQTRNIAYICRCTYCTGVDKKVLQEKIAKREMLKEIQEYSLTG